MKSNLLVLCFLVITLLTSEKTQAQYSEPGWIFGIGFNFIDDSGLEWIQPFNANDNWSGVPYPSRISAGYVLTNGIFFQSVGSFNKYREGVIVNGNPQPTEWNYYALDALVGYSFKNLIAPEGWFDPFMQTGLGLKRLNGNNELTFDVGGGFNFWINERFAINLNTLGKWGLDNETNDYHVQHAIGVIFKPNLGGLGSRKCYNFN